MKLSIVATLYRSGPYIQEFHQRASTSAFSLVGNDYEIVLVNDGSPDNSLEIATTIAEKDPHVIVVDLSRNFGHHKAMMTGLSYARGERVFLIDSDLEEEPEWLIDFWGQMLKDNCDVVFGAQKNRKGGWFERLSGFVFYKIFNALAGFDLPTAMVTARLMTRRYLDALLLHRERELSIGGLYYITGFDQRSKVIKKLSSSPSTYTLRRKFSLMVNSIASFSSKPLVGIFFFGLSVLALSLGIILYFAINALFFGYPPTGWTSLIISVWALGGLVISCIGIVGIYISKIYEETKQRPYTIIRDVYQKPNYDKSGAFHE